MKLLRLAPENTKFPFMRFRRVSYPFSAVLSIISVILFLTVGMNFGIDFSGGTLLEVQAKSGTADLSYIRDLSDHLGLGILTSIITAVTMTRMMIALWYRRSRATKLPI